MWWLMTLLRCVIHCNPLNDVLLLEEDELQRQAKKKRAFLFLAYAARQLGSVVSRLGKIYRSQLDWDDHV
jgi:hypothetical protein